MPLPGGGASSKGRLMRGVHHAHRLSHGGGPCTAQSLSGADSRRGPRAFFLLSEADQRAINQQHSEAHTRLGFALQLCALQYLGFAADDLTTAPAVAVEYVAQQLGVAPQTLTAYGTRRPTRTTDLQHVQAHLHFRLATPLDMYALQTWLGERALEHDKPTLLLQLACDKLRRDHIVRPGLTRLERLVATARQQAHDETWRRLTPLADGRPVRLARRPPRSGSPDGPYRPQLAPPRSHGPHGEADGRDAPEGRVFVGGADRDLGPRGAQPQPGEMARPTGLESPTPQLQRMDPRRRYPILVAFLHQALLHHTDVAVELYDQCLWEYHSAAQKELKELRHTIARSTNEKLRMFRALGQVLLDTDHRRCGRPGREFCPGPRSRPPGGRRRDGRVASAAP